MDTTSLARPRHRMLLATASALVAVALTALPASARQDAGPTEKPSASSTSSTTDGRCPLRRVGSQLVRCDNLTGNGVAAPAWVLER